jgi:hypothetical protein
MSDLKPDARGADTSNLNAAATGVDRRTLDAIFRHPLAHNLAWREVVSLFATIGGAEEKHNGEFVLQAGADTLAIRKPRHKDLTGPEVMDVRHFLTRAGWSPDAAPPTTAEAAAPEPSRLEPGLIVVVDHAGARIYTMDRSVAGHGVIADDPRHLLHHIERKRRDEDRDETYPDDERFFEQIAGAVSAGGEIVVIGHGKGQSREADHLSAYLSARHPLTYARIVREIVADLPHLTTPELLALGRHAFGPG